MWLGSGREAYGLLRELMILNKEGPTASVCTTSVTGASSFFDDDDDDDDDDDIVFVAFILVTADFRSEFTAVGEKKNFAWIENMDFSFAVNWILCSFYRERLAKTASTFLINFRDLTLFVLTNEIPFWNSFFRSIFTFSLFGITLFFFSFF